MTHLNKKEEEPKPFEKKPGVPKAPWRMKKAEREAYEEEEAKKELTRNPQGKKKNNKILASMPANWEEEERKFFEAREKGENYDPQFLYDSPATNKRFLKMFPAPKYEYMETATKIINAFLKSYGTHSNYQEILGEVIQDQEEVKDIINEYLEELGEEVVKVARVNFSSKNVAATSVTYDNWSSKIRINV